MIQKRYFSFVLALFFSLSLQAQTTETTASGAPWNLQQCLDYARENNLSVEKIQLSVESARWSHIQSIAALFPTLNGSISHSMNFGLRFDQTSGLLQDQRFQNSFVGLSSQFIIFNGLSNYNAIGQASYAYKASQTDFQKALDDLSLNIVDLYMQVLFAQERLVVLEQQRDLLQNQADRAKILVEAGSTTLGDQLSIEAQLAQQQVQVITGKNTVISTKLALIQALNLTVTDIELVMPDLSAIPIDSLTQEENAISIYNTSLGIRPAIKSATYRYQAAKKGLAVSRGAYYPTLSMNISVGSSFSELRKENPLDPFSPTIPFFDQMRQNNSQQLTFGLNVPIFNGLQTRTQVQQAKVQMLSSELDMEIEKQNLRNTIQKAFADAQAAYLTFQANSKNLESLETSFNFATEKFNVGALSAIEYNDAATRYYNAQTELLIARYDYIFKTKVLDFYKGNPLELK